MKNKKYLWILLVIVFVICVYACMYARAFISAPNTYVLSFKAEANTDIEYQIFYTLDPNGSFNEEQSIKEMVTKGENTVRIEIPHEQIAKLRIDFGTNPQGIVISNLELIGENTIEFNDPTLFDVYDINDIFVVGNKLLVRSELGDPHVEYKIPIDFKGKKNIDYKKIFKFNL